MMKSYGNYNDRNAVFALMRLCTRFFSFPADSRLAGALTRKLTISHDFGKACSTWYLI